MNKEFLNLSIKTNKAFLEGLVKSELLKRSDSSKIQKKLNQIKKDRNFKKNFKNKKSYQEQIQNYLQKRLRKSSKIIPKYSSTKEFDDTTRIKYQIISLEKIRKDLKKLTNQFFQTAKKYKNSPYKNSTVGHYFIAYTESLIEDLILIKNTEKIFNKSPLGNKEITKILERELMTKKLELKNTVINSIFAKKISNKFNSLYLEVLLQISISLEAENLIEELKAEKTLKSTNRTIYFTEAILELIKSSKPKIKKSKALEIKEKSLGSAGNLDLDFYKRKLSKL